VQPNGFPSIRRYVKLLTNTGQLKGLSLEAAILLLDWSILSPLPLKVGQSTISSPSPHEPIAPWARRPIGRSHRGLSSSPRGTYKTRTSTGCWARLLCQAVWLASLPSGTNSSTTSYATTRSLHKTHFYHSMQT